MVKRPVIHWRQVLFLVIIIIVTDFALTWISIQLIRFFECEEFVKKWISLIEYIYLIPIRSCKIQIFLTFLFCSFLIHLKSILIFMVRLYQLWAPDTVRMSCLYEPTCSEYMIMAIEKYGCIKGVAKGVNRLRRCHSPNGGIDYP